MNKPILVGVDTGGTFTDFIIINKGEISVYKTPSTPKNPALAIINGIKELNLKTDFELIHGSTVATNAFLEHIGAKVLLITTKGFEDLLEIGRQNRHELYNLKLTKVASLVSHHLRMGVNERMDYKGNVLSPLKIKNLKYLENKIQKKKPEAIAVCLLFGYLNPKHENLIKNFLSKLNIPISLSSEILPEYREYERLCATVLNAYVSPKMSFYLESLKSKVKTRNIKVMQSNGGTISIKSAQKEAVRTLLSGPAGGVAGAFYVACKAGYDQIITFDMGGTSTDVCLIDKKIKTTSEMKLENIPISIPMIPIHTVGAGGGSLAFRDAGGALKVGPHSAGADPGPICFGRGKEITVTDAHLFLGRIHPESYLGGKMKLNTKRLDIFFKKLALTLKIKPSELAEGILKIANVHMENAIRVISLQKGFDPRDFTLIPFGGAGSLHACEIARDLNIKRILIPQNPGALSALGMCLSPVIKNYSQTLLLKESSSCFSKIKNVLKKIKTKALSEFKKEGFNSKELIFEPTLDIRYQGQSFDVNVLLTKNFKRDFVSSYKKQYGHVHQNHLIEIVNVRLKVWAQKNNSLLLSQKFLNKKLTTIPTPFDKKDFVYENKKIKLPFYWREQFQTGQQFNGPLVICEYSATTFVPPSFKGEIDNFGNMILK